MRAGKSSPGKRESNMCTGPGERSYLSYLRNHIRLVRNTRGCFGAYMLIYCCLARGRTQVSSPKALGRKDHGGKSLSKSFEADLDPDPCIRPGKELLQLQWNQWHGPRNRPLTPGLNKAGPVHRAAPTSRYLLKYPLTLSHATTAFVRKEIHSFHLGPIFQIQLEIWKSVYLPEFTQGSCHH